jgi:hypothetical protein
MLTKEDTLRVILARIAEWDVNISGGSYFDHKTVLATADADRFAKEAPELALDHG